MLLKRSNVWTIAVVLALLLTAACAGVDSGPKDLTTQAKLSPASFAADSAEPKDTTTARINIRPSWSTAAPKTSGYRMISLTAKSLADSDSVGDPRAHAAVSSIAAIGLLLVAVS